MDKFDRNGIRILKLRKNKKRQPPLAPLCKTLADSERRMCLEKVKFETESDAKTCNKGQRPYKCPVCDGWHLTSTKIRIEA